MALAHTLGFSRIDRDRELNKALEAFRAGDLDEAGLHKVGQQLRAAHWQLQKDAGIDLLPVGDFAWYDQVLSHSLTFGVIAQHLRPQDNSQPTLHSLCAQADASACARWFDTPDHYHVPVFNAEQSFALSWEQLFEEVEEAHALGHRVKPVLIGPLSYLWLGKAQDADFNKLDLVDRLLPLYGQIFQRLAAQGVEWVQIDEPILALDLPQEWKNAYERVYNLLQREPLKKLVATCFGGLEGNLGLAVGLPVDGLHIDLVRAPNQYATVIDRLPAYKILSLGLVDGETSGSCDLHGVLDVLRHANERLGERLWVAPSCALLHGHDQRSEVEPQNGLALGVLKCREVALLAEAAKQPEAGYMKCA